MNTSSVEFPNSPIQNKWVYTILLLYVSFIKMKEFVMIKANIK